MKLSKTESAYLAGIIDGEGTIRIKRRRRMIIVNHKQYGPYFSYQAGLSISNTSLDLLSWLKQKLGGKGSYLDIKQRDPKWKPCGRFEMTGHRATLALEKVYPFLIIKKNLARVTIRLRKHQESNTSRKVGSAQHLDPLYLESRKYQSHQSRHLEKNEISILESKDIVIHKTLTERVLEVTDYTPITIHEIRKRLNPKPSSGGLWLAIYKAFDRGKLNRVIHNPKQRSYKWFKNH